MAKAKIASMRAHEHDEIRWLELVTAVNLYRHQLLTSLDRQTDSWLDKSCKICRPQQV